jgi:hypothetical protein
LGQVDQYRAYLGGDALEDNGVVAHQRWAAALWPVEN